MDTEKTLLKFAIIGNIDDGKSSLIGRLLVDSKALYDDQLAVLEKNSKEKGSEFLNYALLTDGLKSEREQGITIDIAYRYFATEKRKFIIIDCPGHFQYTHNTFTGLSNCNTAILLIDASKGIKEQTKRHTFLSSLLGIKYLIVCINKMDLVNYSEEIYKKIKSEFIIYTQKLNIEQINFIPISALKGDNLINHSNQMTWYKKNTLLDLLESININNDLNLNDLRFPIQNILYINTSDQKDYRAYTGRIESGIMQVGNSVTLLPSGLNTQIKSINFAEKTLDRAFDGMSVSIQLNDEFDVSRGNMIIKTNTQINISQNIELLLYSVSSVPIKKGNKYIIKHNTQNTKCIIKEIYYKIDINSLEQKEDELSTLNNNDIAKITLYTSEPLLFDTYKQNKNTGSLILIDEITNNTIAAGIIL